MGNIRCCESETHIAGDMSHMQPGAGALASRGTGSDCAGRNLISPQRPVAVASANPNHGGLVIAALGCRFDRPPNSARLLSHHRRFTHPRRADDRRSRKRVFVHSKNRFCFGRPSHRKPRAGDVSPPWGAVRMRAPNGKSRTLPLQTRFAHPRRAGDCRSWLPIRSSAEQCSVVIARAPVHAPTAG